MESLVEYEPETTEEEWARLFLHNAIAATNSYSFLLLIDGTIFSLTLIIILAKLSQQLLFSYLQLICFYAAKQISSQLKRSVNLQVHYSLEDCLAIATEISLKPAKLLKSFDFSTSFPLHAYARKVIERSVKNRIVREIKSKSIKLSDWGLLSSLSPKQLETILLNHGIERDRLLVYRLVWQAFKEISQAQNERRLGATYVNGKRNLNSKQIQQIIDYYQQQQSRLALNLATLGQSQVKNILTVCITAARNSQEKKCISLEGNYQLEFLTANDEDNLLRQEENDELNYFKNIVQKKLNNLSNKQQQYLLLWLGLNINQQDFVVPLKLKKQYQVARKFQRYQKKILQEIISDRQINSTTKINTEEQLSSLKAYLQQYGKTFFSDLLAKTIKDTLTTKEKQLLIERGESGSFFPPSNYTIEMNTSQENALSTSDLHIIIGKLQTEFQLAIETSLQIKLKQFKSAPQKVSKFITQWLDNNLASLYIHGDK